MGLQHINVYFKSILDSYLPTPLWQTLRVLLLDKVLLEHKQKNCSTQAHPRRTGDRISFLSVPASAGERGRDGVMYIHVPFTSAKLMAFSCTVWNHLCVVLFQASQHPWLWVHQQVTLSYRRIQKWLRDLIGKHFCHSRPVYPLTRIRAR